jgi:CRISPR type III-B/RAMP module RAMP protein Cmr6
MIAAIKETREEWSRPGPKCRTLACDKFVIFDTGDNSRRDTCKAIIAGVARNEKIREWRDFVYRLAGLERLLFGKLQARLILNAAGGVMENGGMCLDRNSGIPFIPGSAVKGCARKLAIQLLRDKTESKEAGRVELLEAIAMTFGWGKLDWKPGVNREGQHSSDFWWAAGDDQHVIEEAAARLCLRLGAKLDEAKEAWKRLPDFAGSVNFLPAFPWEKDPGIEMDVITCHHPKYYKGGQQGYEAALDNEQPIPVVFPVVSGAREPLFVFTVVANRRGSPEFESQARAWLAAGLEKLGIGGKTTAGYGWLDCSQELQTEVRGKTEKEEQDRVRAEERQRTEEKEKRDRENTEKRRQEEKAATAAMSPEERLDYEISRWTDDQFSSRLDSFLKLDDTMKRAMQRALKGPRAESWKKMKDLAQNGTSKEKKRWIPVADAVRATAKAAKEKMP